MWEVFPYSRHRDQAVRQMKTLIIQNYDEYKNVNVMLSVNLTLTSSINAVGFMLSGVLLKGVLSGVGRIALVQLLQSLKDEIFKILKDF